jgi:hypothetical protein
MQRTRPSSRSAEGLEALPEPARIETGNLIRTRLKRRNVNQLVPETESAAALLIADEEIAVLAHRGVTGVARGGEIGVGRGYEIGGMIDGTGVALDCGQTGEMVRVMIAKSIPGTFEGTTEETIGEMTAGLIGRSKRKLDLPILSLSVRSKSQLDLLMLNQIDAKASPPQFVPRSAAVHGPEKRRTPGMKRKIAAGPLDPESNAAIGPGLGFETLAAIELALAIGVTAERAQEIESIP